MSAAVRADLAAIAEWIRPGEHVLDLGCGDGALLAYLQQTRGVRAYGVENDPENVVACVARGVNVLQLDLEAGLSGFDTGSFDRVILSQTLQAVHNTASVLGEMLRVGREGIVSFPNFGYWRNRLQVLGGRMPVSGDLPYAWHNTPNVHLCTLHDFEQLCASMQASVLERRVLTRGTRVEWLPNLFGSLAIYRVTRAR
ncbi:MAG: methionine biosynthesis protein MetW [Pseudomonadota bacterium]|nr:methionine biosynthesis protein MetW [Pseudomonadota bacterium]